MSRRNKVILYNFSSYDCHLFFKRLVDEENDEVKFKILPKTDKQNISVRDRCIRFIESYRLLSSS